MQDSTAALDKGERRRAYRRKWYQEHAEEQRAKRKAWRAANRKKVRASKRRWYARHAQAVREYGLAHREEQRAKHRARVAANREKYRALRRQRYLEHAGVIRKKRKAAYRANPEPQRKYSRNYQAERKTELSELRRWKESLGRGRKDKERERVRQLKGQGLNWEQIRSVMNKEFNVQSSTDAYRALLRNRGPVKPE